MPSRLLLRLLLVLLLVGGVLWAAEELHCSACRVRIQGRYGFVKRDGTSYPVCAGCLEKLKQQAPVCVVCAKKIDGRYSKVRRGEVEAAVCADCMQKAPRCARCKMPLRDGTLCADCRAAIPNCTGCGKPVIGRHRRFGDGAAFCEACSAGPLCPLCSRPLSAGFRTVGTTRVCQACADKASSCGCCGKLITDTFYRHQFVDEVFCEDCEKNKTHCSICSRPTSQDNLIMLGGKKPLCRTCSRDVVPGVDQLQAMYDEAVRLIDEELGEAIYHRPALRLVDDISEVRRDAGFREQGRPELGLFYRKGHDYTIYVAYGVTTPLAYETLPHEWSHAWFSENAHPKHADWIEEGFCQWVASKVLRKKGYEKSLQVLAGRGDIYGQGYRFLQSLEDEGGTEAVMQYVKSPPPANPPVADQY